MYNRDHEIEVPSFLKEDELKARRQQLEMEKYERAKRNSVAKKIKKRKVEMKKKVIKTTLVAAASYTIGILSVCGFQQFKGSEIIADNFYSYASEYGIINSSSGYIAISGGKEISIDSAMEDLINDARYGGMSDVEINIGISKIYGSDLANNYIGDFSIKDKITAKENAYHESQIEEYNKNIGGMTR